MRRVSLLLFASFVFVVLISVGRTAEATGGAPPPNPSLYSGSVSVGGGVPGDSVVKREGVRNRCVSGCITVKIGDFVSDGGIVLNGNYTVTVGPPNSTYVGQDVVFYYDDLVVASQMDRFVISPSFRILGGFDLTFPALPTPTPLPTATPTQTPVPTPTPVPTATPVATATPVPTATPSVLSAISVSGVVRYEGPLTDPFQELKLLARVGSYFSSEVKVRQAGPIGVFEGLLIDPVNRKYLNKRVDFLLGDLEAVSTEVILFDPYLAEIEVELYVVDERELEAEAPLPTVAEVEPTTVPNTPVRQPTVAPLPTKAPVHTPQVLPSQTPETEELEEEEDSGGCGTSAGRVSASTGAVNALMMFSPLFLVAGVRTYRRRRR